MKTDQAKIKELEEENARFKKIVADLSLDNAISKGVSRVLIFIPVSGTEQSPLERKH
ncbi:MAG: hypothetical protein A4E62_00599 [Syntrophorhabdus sp. PtaU1.Bin002]|nr:MAG: hypothetical protein A4E62_00599 [Syntrophorhabdus sp. PtaU1.Bin002]